jgi:stringent starvation protein B
VARSRRPYLIRAVYDWAADNGFTPHLLIAADAEGVVVPREYVKEGRITLNISPMAVQNLDLGRDPIRFFARFAGQPFEVQVPSGAVLAVFARENGEGAVFGEVEAAAPAPAARAGTTPAGSGTDPSPGPRGKPKLRVVK